MSRPWAWILVATVACTFDASGFGEPPGRTTGGAASGEAGTTGTGAGTGGVTDAGTGTSAGGLTGSGTQEPPVPSTTEGALSEGTTGESTSTTTTGPETSSTGEMMTSAAETTTSTTGPPACDGMFVKQITLVADATVAPPMTTQVSMMGEGTVAFSGVAEQGTVTFGFEVPCTGAFAVWGRVLDHEPGVENYDPDSFYVHADDQAEAGWFFGCQTQGQPAAYQWLRVQTGAQGSPCDQQVPLTVGFTAGSHTITLRNREQQDNGGNVAVVARLLIVHDPSYTPTPPD